MSATNKPIPSPFSADHKIGRPVTDRLFGGAGSTNENNNREDAISQQALRNARAALTGTQVGNPLEEPIVGISSKGLLSRRSEDLTLSDAQMDKMSDALSKQAKASARQRVAAMRTGQDFEDEDDLPSLHKAQKISFEGRCVKLHLGSKGTYGQNFVALPEMSQTEDAALRMGRGVNVIELNLTKDGKQDIPVAADSLVKGARNLQLQICFSDQRENLRNRDSNRGIE